LNAKANNKTRGSILSIYMVISFGGMALGQWLLNAADPASETLFILCSILLSLALVPILIVRTEAPNLESHASLSVIKVFKSSPAGILTIFVSAIAHGAMFGMGAVYAVEIGMSVADTVVFMSIFIATGALFQWPIGWLSDQIDRRMVIVFVSIIALGLCFVLNTLEPVQPLFFVAYGGLGAMTLPIYSIAVAHTNDRLQPEQMAAASSTIVLVMGIGSIFGPITSGYLLNLLGAPGYLIQIGIVHLIIILAVTYFMFRREAVDEEDQIHYHVVPPRSTTVALEAVAQEAEESMGSEAED
ncbi:MAG: MFS transporter, partial [Gammaproteobacteria bacterium]|nr:MFS transporter [Gammaproteobacteria bacterium]